MSVAWLFESNTTTGFSPRISSQLESINSSCLCLRNPWVSDSVFMGKIYTAMTAGIATLNYYLLYITTAKHSAVNIYAFIALALVPPLTFSPFLAYRIFLIKRLSSFYLNRTTKKIYYQRIGKLLVFEWKKTNGGLFRRTEFGGSSFTSAYSLAFAPHREDCSLHQKDCLWVDSNEPTEPDIQYVAEVWEYLRHFMDHGLDKLPPPSEPNWWHRPLHAICLTPAQAWRHYAPWRTGEPGEMQGKKNWQLPFWAVLFPYNLTVALCWYVICRLFNVKAAPPPPEAFEEAPARLKKRKRA
ncbi:hypothetical protein Q6A49_08680 [Pseudomonas sp. 22-AL-CL-001]|uniref:hypothetical protein n=1 Tax=Pseudomonas alabamensis TaxID=3064349 RepID=UPI0027128555|nr:hypothetical protein [Pseudomonas sp. 22-AL-CL-001]MDO7910603.1 hypothetical protein [Pseudomonas sp. 22-AL-CL-001]